MIRPAKSGHRERPGEIRAVFACNVRNGCDTMLRMDNQDRADLQVLKDDADNKWEAALWLEPSDPAYHLAWADWAVAHSRVSSFVITITLIGV